MTSVLSARWLVTRASSREPRRPGAATTDAGVPARYAEEEGASTAAAGPGSTLVVKAFRGQHTSRRTPAGGLLAVPAVWGLLWGQLAAAEPYPTTPNDFRLPGTQPLTVSGNFEDPEACAVCHANYGAPEVEPFRSWSGSMMGQAGRDPLMYAAMAIANQDVQGSGETCIRCHLPKGWLEGRSAAADGTTLTAADRHGVECSICHRFVDPFAGPGHPVEDDAILGALGQPVSLLGSAMMVVDPVNRLRGPFDVVSDLGGDPHLPTRSTLVSPFHTGSELCGVCHNVGNPIFTRNGAGEYVANALDTAADPALAFPEQSTYDEWAASEYAAAGVYAPQFGRNKDTVSSCQDCHMPDVSGRAAVGGIQRDDLPLHELVGGNTFIPAVLPFHPVFGAEVDAAVMQDAIGKATSMLRRAATVSVGLADGSLTVRVTNESGHKLPTGYPDGRRMWLNVRAFDAASTVVFESGRYVFSTGELVGYEASPADEDHDPYLHVWEAVHGLSPEWAATVGRLAGSSLHLVLNNVREKDNRIPPRGFTNAAYAAFDGAPVGATYADGQYWEDVVYPVGGAAVRAEVTLYYQTASREYVEFLRDENVTNAAGPILYDLWDQHDKSTPVAMATAFYESNVNTINGCHRAMSRAQERYQKKYAKEWAKCFAAEARGDACDAPSRDARIAAAEDTLRDQVLRRCAALDLTPITLGHGSTCPVPCAETVLFDMEGLASCALCQAEALGDATLAAAYGAGPPELPQTVSGEPATCQKAVSKAATGLASSWTAALGRCEDANKTGANTPPVDCAADPDGKIASAQAKSEKIITRCQDFSALAGCPATGTVADTQQCVEDAVQALVPAFVEVAYP